MKTISEYSIAMGKNADPNKKLNETQFNYPYPCPQCLTDGKLQVFTGYVKWSNCGHIRYIPIMEVKDGTTAQRKVRKGSKK